MVSTLVVEWIEITIPFAIARAIWVSTLVVEWIEMAGSTSGNTKLTVSTLVVEWIEIGFLHRECLRRPASPPSWWSGLKLLKDVKKR